MTFDEYLQTVSFRENCPCPYFGDGRTATVECCLSGDAPAEEYDRLLDTGYRRLGRIFYHNVCAGCSACRPLRIDPAAFTPSKSQRRTLRMNSDIRIRQVMPASVSCEKLALYRAYLSDKHGGGREDEDFASHLEHIHYGYPGAIEMDYYIEDRLIAVGIVDASVNGLSANYFYYDTRILDRRPGVFSILKEIELARRLGKAYYYLGYCIEENPKMRYKKFFRPNQVLDDGEWNDFVV